LGLGPPPRRYDPESKLSRAATPDGEAADYCQTFISSSHCKVVFIACLRAHFDVVPRKLIAELQAFSKSIQETPMVRFYSSIYADDKMFIRQMSCDSAFHGSPHQIAAAHRTSSASVPDHAQRILTRVGNWLFLRNAMTFEVGVAETPLQWARFYVPLDADLIN
jgi:hypothetical protein